MECLCVCVSERENVPTRRSRINRFRLGNAKSEGRRWGRHVKMARTKERPSHTMAVRTGSVVLRRECTRRGSG